MTLWIFDNDGSRRPWRGYVPADFAPRIQFRTAGRIDAKAGDLVLAHGFSVDTFRPKVDRPYTRLPHGQQVSVIHLTGQQRPEEKPERTSYGWLFPRATFVGNRPSEPEFTICLFRFLTARDSQRVTDDPPFLLLEPVGPGPNWRDLKREGARAGAAVVRAAIAEYEARYRDYKIGGLNVGSLVAPDALSGGSAAHVLRALNDAELAMAAWAGDHVPPPSWVENATTFAHNQLKNRLLADPDTAGVLESQVVVEPGAAPVRFATALRRGLERIRREWQTWVQEMGGDHPVGNLDKFSDLARAAVERVAAFEREPASDDAARALRTATVALVEHLALALPIEEEAARRHV